MVNYVIVNDAESCQQKCQEVEELGCQFWSYDSIEKICYRLPNSRGGSSCDDKANCKRGPRICPGIIQFLTHISVKIFYFKY